MLGSEQTTIANRNDVPRAEKIARLNDQLRTTGTGGQILITRGVMALPGFDAPALMQALKQYDSFDIDNDPHGERDFGGFDLWSAEQLFKVDYYAPDMMFGSNDPADPAVTHRVLTVMLAEEY
ncbi:MAG: DUF3768 domain-containing protein [Sphingomicrobium sp.]